MLNKLKKHFTILSKPFFSQLRSLSLVTKIAFLILTLFTLFYPGHNFYQTLQVSKGRVKGASFKTADLSPFPHNDKTPAPYLTAFSVIARDLNSNSFIYTKNPQTKLYPASTTKIMTALVALDQFKLSEELVVQNAQQAIGHSMKLQEGEVITFESLLYGLLVESGNDAALAIANNYPGGYDVFIQAMNYKAKKLHLNSTHFLNPSGIEKYGHFTTARDLSILAQHAVKNPIINRIMQTRNIVVTDTTGKIVHNLKSTNELLGKVEGLKGLKTGWTQHAGECLVSYIERDNKPITTVILKSQDRFGETEKLINWIYNHHTWKKPDLNL